MPYSSQYTPITDENDFAQLLFYAHREGQDCVKALRNCVVNDDAIGNSGQVQVRDTGFQRVVIEAKSLHETGSVMSRSFQCGGVNLAVGFTVTQCKNIQNKFVNAGDQNLIIYDPNADGEFLTHSTSIASKLSTLNLDINCPLILCKIYKQGCTNEYIGTTLKIENIEVLKYENTNNGFDETVCVKCKNEAGEEFEIRDWRFYMVSQRCSGTLTLANNASPITEPYSQTQTHIEYPYDHFITNSDVVNCPITSCSISITQCDQNPLPIVKDFVNKGIKVFFQNLQGFDCKFSLDCQNSGSVIQALIQIIQDPCPTMITPTNFEPLQLKKFQIPEFTASCGYIISYELGTQQSSTQVPDGLTLTHSQGFIEIAPTDPTIVKDYEFWLYYQSENLSDKIGPYILKVPCSRFSNTDLAAPSSLRTHYTWVITSANWFQKPSFTIDVFSSKCPVRYFLSSSANMIREIQDFSIAPQILQPYDRTKNLKISMGNKDTQTNTKVFLFAQSQEDTIVQEIKVDVQCDPKMPPRIKESEFEKQQNVTIGRPVNYFRFGQFQLEVPECFDTQEIEYKICEIQEDGNCKEEKEMLQIYQDDNEFRVSPNATTGPQSFDFKILASYKSANFKSELCNLNFQREPQNEAFGSILKSKIESTETFNSSVSESLFANITSIDHFGLMKIEFNEMMDTSSNFSTLNLSHIDMYIVQSRPKPLQPQDSLNLNFTWNFEGFEVSKNDLDTFRHRMLFKLDFLQPFNISQEQQYDRLIFHIKDERTSQYFFRAKDTGNYLNITTLEGVVDRQIPDNNQTRSAEKFFEYSTKTSKWIYFLVFGIQVVFDGGAQKYLLFFTQTIQMIFHLPMMRVNFPGNTLMMISIMMPLVLFDFLENPWEFDASSVLEFDEFGRQTANHGLNDQTQNIGYDDTNAISNLGFIFVMIMAYFIKIVYTLLVCIFWKITGYGREYAQIKIDQIFFSDILALCLEGYFEFLIAGYFQVMNPLKTNQIEKLSTAFGYIVLAIALLIVPIINLKFIFMNKDEQKLDKTFAKFGPLFEHIKMRERSTLFYTLFFMFRRAAFLLIAFFETTPIFQTIALMYLCLINVIYQGHYLPFLSHFDNCLSLFNDFIVFICTLHLMCFSNETDNAQLTFETYGRTFMATCGLLFAINFPIIMYNSVFSIINFWTERDKLDSSRQNVQSQVQEVFLDYPKEGDAQSILKKIEHLQIKFVIMRADKILREEQVIQLRREWLEDKERLGGNVEEDLSKLTMEEAQKRDDEQVVRVKIHPRVIVESESEESEQDEEDESKKEESKSEEDKNSINEIKSEKSSEKSSENMSERSKQENQEKENNNEDEHQPYYVEEETKDEILQIEENQHSMPSKKKKKKKKKKTPIYNSDIQTVSPPQPRVNDIGLEDDYIPPQQVIAQTPKRKKIRQYKTLRPKEIVQKMEMDQILEVQEPVETEIDNYRELLEETDYIHEAEIQRRSNKQDQQQYIRSWTEQVPKQPKFTYPWTSHPLHVTKTELRIINAIRDPEALHNHLGKFYRYYFSIYWKEQNPDWKMDWKRAAKCYREWGEERYINSKYRQKVMGYKQE